MISQYDPEIYISVLWKVKHLVALISEEVVLLTAVYEPSCVPVMSTNTY